MGGNDSAFIKNTVGGLYDKYVKYKVSGGINGNQNKKTYLFLTSLTAGNVLGSCSIEANNKWGNFYIVFNAGLKDGHTIMHECGHSLSLPNVFKKELAQSTNFIMIIQIIICIIHGKQVELLHEL